MKFFLKGLHASSRGTVQYSVHSLALNSNALLPGRCSCTSEVYIDVPLDVAGILIVQLYLVLKV